MRKIIYSQMVSLDGYVEGPNGELEWSVPGDELHKHFNDQYLAGEIDTSLYGRKLYENMAGYWPEVEADDSATALEREFSSAWKKTPKIVFSTTLDEVEWNSSLQRKVDPQEIKKLKQQPGNNMDVGGADLASTFIKLGLVDEYRLYVHPVVLGGGKPMFPANETFRLQPIETRRFSCGVAMLRYQRE
ncbi:dihydrofolate reductase family protein [Aliifodinibius sp. S!AR15-10]|uniref:dihydrofolate reductase family protein n=1 Tax=Aliifodinibius sp. S!AR15-10 TaxID=2950437 RepID=UPI0028670A7A|nr:dihydrofolate reductase family protein [Aliifodinibius sp. S!AR15-10]MDR8393737.1 dihydrofolate reductase family protein [Aliifodinibius sp. S!AR15-10]